MKWLIASLLILVWTPLHADEARISQARQTAGDFLGGKLDEVWEAFSPELRELFGTKEKLQSFREDLTAGFGHEAEVLGETTEHDGTMQVYVRRSRWTASEAAIVMRLAVGAGGQVTGFEVKAEPVLAESRYLSYQTRTPLRLPFKGEWFVVWGGRTLDLNYHAADRAQRFAIDVLVYRDGATHDGDPQGLENYHCWDRPILAPADAKVARSVDRLPDNVIGSTDANNPAGNHVVLDFGNGEFGFLAHLRQGSVAVRAGDNVTAGQEIGRCGNSGNTSEPHLHFHLQTTPVLGDGEGLPAFFEDYVADGSVVERGEPVKGQIVSPAGSD